MVRTMIPALYNFKAICDRDSACSVCSGQVRSSLLYSDWINNSKENLALKFMLVISSRNCFTALARIKRLF